MISFIDIVEHIVGSGENASYQYFLLFPQLFKMFSSQGCSKSDLCDEGFLIIFLVHILQGNIG